MPQWLLAILLAALCPTLTQAQALSGTETLRMPSLFADHMVVQRERSVPVWGRTTPGAAVQVRMASHTVRAVAAADSTWRTELPAMEAGGPHTLTVTSGNATQTFEDVLVGEVWLASGQSNMEWAVRAAQNADQEIAAAQDDRLRLFTAARTDARTPQWDVTGTWATTRPETVADFSAVAYYFGRRLRAALGVPVGLISSNWGGTPVEAWTSASSLDAMPTFRMLLDALEVGPDSLKDAISRPQDVPSALYNGMIAPLVSYALRGAIWYQGESNAHTLAQAAQYRTLFPLLIQDWRTRWDQPEMPFLFVQLANFMEPPQRPVQTAPWPLLREAQTHALTLPHTGMAVTIDIGAADDIHPRNKQDVGERLARAALHGTYGHNVVPSGPLYHRMDREGSAVRLHFDHVAGGLEARGGPLQGFAIAGPDRSFVKADARIEDGSVVVSSPDVDDPVAVRYGWANNPTVNLYNAAGLPASPFRTDGWPMPYIQSDGSDE
jgi:sialate O-acetylesterase